MLYPAFFASMSGADAAKLDHALEHAASYAVIYRHAYVPTVFADSGATAAGDVTGGGIAPGGGDYACLRGYDYVWAYKPPAALLAYLKRSATLAAAADESTLWPFADSVQIDPEADLVKTPSAARARSVARVIAG